MRLSIAKQLSVGFGIVISLIVISAWSSLLGIREMNNQLSKLVDEGFPEVMAYNTLLIRMNQSLAAIRGYIILGSDAQQAEQFKADRAEAWTVIDAALEDVRRLRARAVDVADNELAAQMERDIEEFRRAQEQIESIAHTPDNVRAEKLLRDEGAPLARQLMDAVTGMIESEVEKKVDEERRKLLLHLANLRHTLALALGDVRALVLFGDARNEASFEQSWASYDAAVQAVGDQASLFQGDQIRQWEEFEKLRARFASIPEKVIALRQADDWDQASYILATKALPRADAVTTAIEELKKASVARMANQRDAVEAGGAAVRTTLLWATLFAIVVGCIVVLLMSRRIVSAIQALAGRAEAIADGRLTGADLAMRSQDELGRMAESFNRMVAGLKDLAGQTKSVTGNITSAAAEILASTQQQVASTKEQAATIQQISSTMQEVSQSGQQISARANEVASSAEAAAAASQSGIHAVQSTTTIMDGIREQVEEVAENIVALSEKTQAVGEITATVNDIAEQSNLLALNATIEAAEAGSQGNRFAVVAAEMKNLADRAKECTVQVRTILGDIQKGINTSVMLTEEAVKRVETGKEQADVSEGTIREMSESTEQCVQAFQQILASANQQQIGFEQVSQGMQDIRQAAEQTATGTSQLEQAVASLNALGEQLRSAVGRYEL